MTAEGFRTWAQPGWSGGTPRHLQPKADPDSRVQPLALASSAKVVGKAWVGCRHLFLVAEHRLLLPWRTGQSGPARTPGAPVLECRHHTCAERSCLALVHHFGRHHTCAERPCLAFVSEYGRITCHANRGRTTCHAALSGNQRWRCVCFLAATGAGDCMRLQGHPPYCSHAGYRRVRAAGPPAPERQQRPGGRA